jgi:hypothetical protein
MMPKGKYYIGDLCYVMADDEWLDICDITIQGTRVLEGEFQLKDGRRFAMYSTAYGDGVYYDEYGHSYSVDSGSIGCILLDDIKYVDNFDQFLDVGAILEFDENFVTVGGRGESDWEGMIQFGHVVIETTPSYEEEEYE